MPKAFGRGAEGEALLQKALSPGKFPPCPETTKGRLSFRRPSIFSPAYRKNQSIIPPKRAGVSRT